MTDQIAPDRLPFMPVSVPDQDRVLVRHRDVFVAVAGVRAYPDAVMFQLLIKVRRSDEQFELNIAPDLRHLLTPGGFDFGADTRDQTGTWHPASVHFAGGGGGTSGADGTNPANPAAESHYEYKWWIPLSPDDQGLRLWCSWPAGRIPRTESDLDITRLQAAAHASYPAWQE